MGLTLAGASKVAKNDNLLLITDGENLQKCNEYLSDSEFSALASSKKKGATQFALPQANRTIFVQSIKESDCAIRQKEVMRKEGNELLDLFKYSKIDNVHVINLAKENFAFELLEGMVLGNYQFLKYFKNTEPKKNLLKKIKVHSSALNKKELDRLKIITDATCAARTLVNEPLSYLTAERLSEEFKTLSKEAGIKVEVYKKKKITSLKMGGLLSVNKGSVDPPTFTIMEYKPAKAKNKKPIVLVGKGVVYDTGGLSLKPTSNSMDFMKSDMAGAAIAACSIYAIARAKLPIHVISLIPATDNRPGGNAYVPGDVITTYSGTNVEVLNTDAEGRMILADALHFAKKLKPELVIDFATLTGSAARAVGSLGIVYMGNADKETKSKLETSGYSMHERLVEFPLWEEYGEMLKSDIADIKNVGGPYAGAITAGKFLQHFTDYPWLHLDVAGPSYVHTADSYRGKNGTGVGVRLIFDFISNY